MGRLRKKRPVHPQTPSAITDPVLIASFVLGPLHATIAAAITPFSTKESLCAATAMPERVVAAVITSLVSMKLVSETPLDHTCSYYALMPPSPDAVIRILGPSRAKLVTTTVLKGRNRRSYARGTNRS